ncbi:hypothetical protein GUITHDRAFT_99914 [Guillardia theta CCMP2712]|uniref:FAD/NAD(P)-binding domain-containing protein n=2 Tax=Guillardia theta TaxID=55529 RepID=L1K1V4_GUITC|nr:hypothetical protein GUITHDRAFT_99914 [Guillardia theta CCMP2712]EKX54435.1 hypothetical protein GUITHDRAFT_99914 [Guillardia theta CCMP2712]|eukprot:XP_005841415.1 hypothetical protein GUITHDRAFT_99914 [Guillardia theta CCMP2712]
MASTSFHANFVIVGGGISGVTCCQELSRIAGDSKIALVAGCGLLKGASNVVKLSRHLNMFEIVEQPLDSLNSSNTLVLSSKAKDLDVEGKKINLSDGSLLSFDKLCICTGARPKVLSSHPRVLSLRDTESAKYLQSRVKRARRVMVAGNGGIAMELVHEIRDCEVVWAVRDGHIGNAFFDEEAGRWMFPTLADRLVDELSSLNHLPLPQSVEDEASAARAESGVRERGSSLGPQWQTGAFGVDYRVQEPRIKAGLGTLKGSLSEASPVFVKFGCEVVSVEGNEQDQHGWPLMVSLSSGEIVGCDYLISAIGVVPNSELVKNSGVIALDANDAIVVGSDMASSVKHVFAAGDVCSVQLPPDSQDAGGGSSWFQMRLWSQAQQQGLWAAQCMLGNADPLRSPFDLFAHATYFFGYKVVLLGRYNGQALNHDSPSFKMLKREEAGKEFIRVILYEGKIEGAVLLGETDLEETFENLILNRLDVSFLGDRLLDPSLDLEDFFD